jgi:D-glycero-D-manno-heptose 1,7-bisphosphate phosphatase
MASNDKSRAVFVDRDGTIMRDADYCSDPKQVEIFPGVPNAMRRLKAAGYKLIVITNQSGIGRGFFTLDQYHAVEAEVSRQVEGLIDATYFCPDVPGQRSSCRKPEPGMVLQAARDHHVDLGRSFFVGDKESDVQCGQNADLRTVRVRTGLDRAVATSGADWVVEDFAQAAETILTCES